MIKLTKTDTGYVTSDGRWVITKKRASGSANMIGGYSSGKTYWGLEDTTRQAVLRPGSALPYRNTFERLYEARDAIENYNGTEK